MRQTARPKFGASRVLHSRAREPRVGHATSRAALSLIALGVACLGLTTVRAGAATTTTTTLPPAIIVAGNAYARHLLSEQPVPPNARAVSALPTPDGSLPIVGGLSDVRQAQHFYVLPASISVAQFVRAHLPKGEAVAETGTGNAPPMELLGLSVHCDSPHVTNCAVYYATSTTKGGQQELAIAAQVNYLPVLHVKMPIAGVVTITGYGKLSLASSSSDPSSVVLTHDQALTLRSAIEGLKDLGTDSGCMEDSLLLKIKIVKDGKVVWSATADSCPGALSITSATTNAILDNENCSFWHAVDGDFPSGAASATKSMSTETCAASQLG